MKNSTTGIVCLLRGVNVGGRGMISMEALRKICEALGLEQLHTYVQSGNVVFCADEKKLLELAKKIGNAIERKAGFRPEVILRTASQLKEVIAKNPFVGRHGIEPGKLHVMFLAAEPDAETVEKANAVNVGPEEMHAQGRELYIYFPDGAGKSKLVPKLARVLKNSGTARNWNTVTKLLEMAEALD